MISTNPEFNKPTLCKCAKCGTRFMKDPWSGAYSINGSRTYRYQDTDEFPLVILCDTCAEEELRTGHVGRIIY